MPNETDSRLEYAESAGPRRAGGHEDVASQYVAIEHAQRAHDDAVRELRDELQRQRERLDELADRAGSGGPGPKLEGVLMRLAELERKAGEGASDPLLDEIAHRLADLERDPGRGGRDPRVEELAAEVRRLKQSAADPRTDDVVLRIASLEGAFKRQSRGGETQALAARLDALEKEAANAAGGELDEIERRLDGLDRRLTEALEQPSGDDGEAVAAVLERVEGIERETRRLDRMREEIEALGVVVEGAPSDELVREIERRVAAIERAEQAASGASSEWHERLAELQAGLGDLRSSLTLAVDAVQDRVQALENVSSDHGSLVKSLASLSERVESVESRPAGVSEARVDALSHRLQALEAAAEEAGDEEELDNLRRRLAALEDAGVASVQDDERSAEISEAIDELRRKIDAIAAGIDRDETARRIEALEQIAPRPAEIDDLRTRLAELETAERSSADGDAGALSRRLEEIEARLDASSAADPVVAGLMERVSRLESSADAMDGDFEGVGDLRARIAELAARIESPGMSASPDASADPRVAELIERLERAEAERGETSEPPAWARQTADELAALRGEVEALSRRPAGGSSAPAADVQELAESLGAVIASAVNESEVKVLRSQMYIVFFTIGLLAVLSIFLMIRAA